MKTFILVAAVGLGLGSMLVPMNGQTTRGQERPPVTVRVDTDLVAVDVTATDQSGNYVRDLREDEMEVYEDGKRRRIDFFSVTDEATLSRPIAVVFALDLSGSLRTDEMTTLHQAALKFTELMKGDAVFAALTFNYEIKIIQGFTDDPRRIERAFSKPGDSGGSTRIYDALDRAITMLARQAPKQRRGRSLRRVVVVISDGFDSASVIDKRELIRRAQAAEVTVYSVTLPSYMLSPTRSGERVITPLDAMRIVSATGGRDFRLTLPTLRPSSRLWPRRFVRAMCSHTIRTCATASSMNCGSRRRGQVYAYAQVGTATLHRAPPSLSNHHPRRGPLQDHRQRGPVRLDRVRPPQV